MAQTPIPKPQVKLPPNTLSELDRLLAEIKAGKPAKQAAAELFTPSRQKFDATLRPKAPLTPVERAARERLKLMKQGLDPSLYDIPHGDSAWRAEAQVLPVLVTNCASCGHEARAVCGPIMTRRRHPTLGVHYEGSNHPGRFYLHNGTQINTAPAHEVSFSSPLPREICERHITVLECERCFPATLTTQTFAPFESPERGAEQVSCPSHPSINTNPLENLNEQTG